jgi:2-hydroxychromene-2-carboxylate isomerase
MSLISDMNSIRPLPTMARERRALVANVAFAAAVLGALWVFEVPIAIPGVLIALLVALLASRLAYRAREGDEEPDAA